jgi:methionyl-tRNA formyltransferase
MYKVVFFGTPEFSVPSLEILNNINEIQVVAVVSMPDRPSGRGKKLKTPPVAQFAKDNQIKLFQTSNINKDEELLNFLNKEHIDFYVVIAFAQFLGKKILNIPKFGAFNIHTSLLPKYRGAAPIQYALLNGDHTTGVSIQRMVKEMDAGDICYDHTVAIEENDTSLTLFKKLEVEAAKGLGSFIQEFVEKNGNVSFKEQNPSEVSFAPTIQKKDGLINPFKENASKIINKMRAFTPWPGCYIFLNDFRLKVLEIEKFPKELRAGEIDSSMGAILLGTSEGTIRLTSVQPEGKKAQKDIDFLNGLKSKNVELCLNEDSYE